jgi:hypothetical protein
VAASFRQVLAVLSEAGVEYVVVGGLAASAHGAARLTSDVDVVYRRTPENLARIVETLKPYHPYLRGAPPGLPFRFDERTLRQGLNFTFSTDLGDLDLLGEMTGAGRYEDLFPASIEASVFGHTCRVVDIVTLIKAKRAAGRPKDLEAIAELEAILEESARLP